MHCDRLRDLDLPWDQSPEQWPDRLVADLGEGAWLVRNENHRYVLRRLNTADATRAEERLNALRTFGLPSVASLGVVDQEDDTALLVTEWPEDAVPLEDALTGEGNPQPLAEDLSMLLAHMHLAGFHWGCGTLAAPLIRKDNNSAMLGDPCHGELSAEISEEQREADLHAARVNLARIVRAANHGRRNPLNPELFASEVISGYRRIWDRIHRTRLFVESGSIQMSTRVTTLGSLPEAYQQQLKDVEDNPFGLLLLGSVSHCNSDNRLMLHLLTGLETRDNNSRLLLRDLFRYHSWLEFSTGRKWPRGLAANRWMNEVYGPAVAGLSALRKTGEACH
ncbi:MAG: DUF4032 domain-containing protein [Acidobacteriota bacterium]|nr:DUF4032 domain-containing protein [Acidobacteriota bacterium]